MQLGWSCCLHEKINVPARIDPGKLRKQVGPGRNGSDLFISVEFMEMSFGSSVTLLAEIRRFLLSRS